MSTRFRVYYWIEVFGQSIKDRCYSIEIERGSMSETNIKVCAQLCAEDYHFNHGGWEFKWPLVFSLSKDDGSFVWGKVEVERETIPHFVGKVL